MSKPFDATGKALLESDPAGWAALLGVLRPPERVRLVDSDLSTVTAAADKVIRIDDDEPWLLNVEFQSWSDSTVPRQLLKYNGLLQDAHGMAVASVLVVLAPAANSPAYTGRLRVSTRLGPEWEFGYTVARVWQLPAEPLPTGPLGLLPLAAVADTPASDLRAVRLRVAARVRDEADPTTATKLFTAIDLLSQLRYGPMNYEPILKGVTDLRDLGLFRAFIDEGRAEGRVENGRATVIRLGRKKFGPPAPEAEAAVRAVTDLARLEALLDKVYDAASWEELLTADAR